MKISVFTPSHDHARIGDCWATLAAQTHQDFEWVVVPNGANHVPVGGHALSAANHDRRVKIVHPPRYMANNVGELKKFACSQCTGDVLLELDHDDLLTPDCLATVAAEVAAAGSDKVFVYSDSITENADGTDNVFQRQMGWRHYQWADHTGRVRTVNATPPAVPRTVTDILFAPDHVRAWTRAGYALAGGHDAALPVGDDHDLVCRSYLAGLEFRHVRRPLYVHRVRPDCTSRVRVHEITAWNTTARAKYLRPLVEAWCRRHQLRMLDLGGAHGCPPGYTPVDPAYIPGPDQAPSMLSCDVFDLPARLAPGSVGCIRAHDFLEHIPTARVPELMNLLYDLLVPGGYLLTHTPAVCDNEGRAGRGAYQDPTHVSFWSSNNFWYYTDRAFAKYLNGAVRCRFQTVRSWTGYPSDWHRLHLIPYVTTDLMSLRDDDANYYPGPRSI